MIWLGEFARRFRMLIHRREFDADLEEEIRLHIELRQQEEFQSGMTAYDAQAAARRRFGNTMYLKRSEEHTSELQSRLHLVCRLLLEKKKTMLKTTTCTASLYLISNTFTC